jgi:hypothetical protein
MGPAPAPTPGWSGFAPPPLGYPPGYEPPAPTAGVVAWEDRSKGPVARWWTTVREVCFNARAFHAAAAEGDDAMAAVWFSTTTGALAGLGYGMFIGLLYGAIGGAAGIAASSRSHGPSLASMAATFAGLGLAAMIVYPLVHGLLGFFGPWVVGGLQHAVLTVLGGATKPYASTVRVSAYSWAPVVFLGIPMAGLLSKALAAVLGVPALCSCCLLSAATSLFIIGR